MDSTQFERFMHDQVQEIKNLGLDSTQTHDWIENNSALFRENWEYDHS